MVIQRLTTTDSTNHYLQQLLLENNDLCDNYVVTAHYQLAGKGQKGNNWESELGQNLLFSILHRPQAIHPSNQFIISRYVALSVVSALRTFINADVRIKWPNDIYVGNSKIAGILIENAIQGAAVVTSVIGIGINVNQTNFISDAPNPISMKQITGLSYNCDDLLSAFLSSFEVWRSKCVEEIEYSYMKELYRSAGYYLYESNGERFMAKVVNVLRNGHLLLEDDTTTLREYALKEVKFILQE